jgi:hypothetical protein
VFLVGWRLVAMPFARRRLRLTQQAQRAQLRA